MKKLAMRVIPPRNRIVAAAGGLGLIAASMTSPVVGAVSCTSTSPALDEQVTCTGSGTADITVPAGATVIAVVVRGAGGGAGYGTGGAGGIGAKVQAEFLISSLSATRVAVGAVGAGGGATDAGSGGGYSAIWRGASSSASDVLVVAGGGGGGQGVASGVGGIGGNGAAVGTAAGGSGASSGGSAVFAGGGDGSGSGGIGGTYCGSDAGAPGQTWSAGGSGGSGFSSTTGGSGGAGYGGGGGGSRYGSGGGGGSFADPAYLNGSAVFSAAGGAGGTVSGASGGSGGAGSVTLTFRSSSGPGLSSGPSNVNETRNVVWKGFGTDATFVTELGNTWVKSPSTTALGRDGHRLLGWSTMADFPVEIAERQVRNGWGAYELFNSQGGIRGVFIPAGSYTFISSDSTLHAIWANGPVMQRC